MKTKGTFYYIPTVGKHTVKTFAGTIPGQTGIHETFHSRYFIGFLDNIWKVKDTDIPAWILPAMLLAACLLGLILI